MAADSNSRKTTPGASGSGTIKLKKSKSKLSDATASRANSPTSSVAGDSITVKSRAFSPDTSVVSANDETNTLCKHCKHRYDKTTDPNHSKLCLRAKQERQRKKKEEKERAERAAAGEDIKQEDTGTPAPGDTSVLDSASKPKKDKSAAGPSADKKQTKKRKATDADSASLADSTTMKPPTKKQKKKDAATAASVADTASLRGTPAPSTKETANASTTTGTTSTTTANTTTKSKPSTAKPKAPVDVERQCGVPLPNGQLCARSLTCKSHAMGAKRSVPGRSLPYDILLAQYQKKNQAKLQKAAMERNAAEEREAGEGEDGGKVDSDEEVERVMAGLSRWAPRPVVEWGGAGGSCWGGVQRRTREVRFREALGDALKGNRGAGLFAVGPRGVQGQQGQMQGQGQEAGGALAIDGMDVLPSSDAAMGEMDRRTSLASRKGSAVAV